MEGREDGGAIYNSIWGQISRYIKDSPGAILKELRQYYGNMSNSKKLNEITRVQLQAPRLIASTTYITKVTKEYPRILTDIISYKACSSYCTF